MAKIYTLSIIDTIGKAKRCSDNAVDENRLCGFNFVSLVAWSPFTILSFEVYIKNII